MSPVKNTAKKVGAFVKDYPMTASGKVQKYKLREMSMELFPEAGEQQP